jgi:TPR repeat protein
MKSRTLFSLLAIMISTSTSLARAQDPQTAHPATVFPPQMEAERKQLLTSAELGDKKHAQMWLGTFYEQGRFGKTDFQEALKWSRKAAAQGDPDAQVGLGQMYEDGEGVQQNYVRAAKWYRKAAEHVPDSGGAGQGRNNLGLLYLKGLTVPKELVHAYMWFSLTGSQTNLLYAKAEMSPAQVLKAERMAQQWRHRHPSK